MEILKILRHWGVSFCRRYVTIIIKLYFLKIDSKLSKVNKYSE
jgi:hypothetical protein